MFRSRLLISGSVLRTRIPTLQDIYSGEGGEDSLEGKTVSALSVFPVSYKGHTGGYVYGVCTDPAQRGYGYAIKLLQEVEQHCMENEGMEFFLLRPAGPTLFGYYQRQGLL